MKNIAVDIKGVKKQFRLPHEKEDSLKFAMINSLKKRGRKGYDTYEALKGIDLQIEKGEFIGILGRNGAGKSTLLKIIAEIYRPSEGSVKVNGRLVPFIELGVGFNKNLSGRDNVYLNAAMLGFSREETDEMYDSIVEFSELDEFMDVKLKNYSSGQQVRLAFSVAIRANADILLLDEVLAVGDASFKKKCYDYFDSLKEDKKTIIFVSHNMSAVRKYCDRGVLIDGGKVAYDGTGVGAADEYIKLFGKGAAAKQLDEDNDELGEKERRGDKAVTIETLDVDVAEKEVRITAIATSSDTPIKDARLGIHIKNKKSRSLIGVNSLNALNGRKFDFAPNETKKLEFVMPNILSDRVYVVSAAINSANGSLTHDVWEDAATIQYSGEHTAYPLIAPARVRIEDNFRINDRSENDKA